jgi:hypothetical protein
MKKTGDIVRFKHETGIAGLFEVVEIIDSENVIVTNDECDSEQHAYTSRLIFVCSVDDRKDI